MDPAIADCVALLCRVLDTRAREEWRLRRKASARGWEPFAVELLLQEYRRRLWDRGERARQRAGGPQT